MCRVSRASGELVVAPCFTTERQGRLRAVLRTARSRPRRPRPRLGRRGGRLLARLGLGDLLRARRGEEGRPRREGRRRRGVVAEVVRGVGEGVGHSWVKRRVDGRPKRLGPLANISRVLAARGFWRLSFWARLRVNGQPQGVKPLAKSRRFSGVSGGAGRRFRKTLGKRARTGEPRWSSAARSGINLGMIKF